MNHNIWFYTTAIAHLSSTCSIKHFCKRIGHMFNIPTTIMLVVNSLNASATWNIIFICGKLKITIIWSIYSHLHKSLTKSTGTHNNSTIQILQSTTCNLASTCRISIYQHHNRHDSVERFNSCLVFMIHTFELSTVRNNSNTLTHEHIYYINSLLLQTTSIVSKVENKILHTLLLQLNKSITNIL